MNRELSFLSFIYDQTDSIQQMRFVRKQVFGFAQSNNLTMDEAFQYVGNISFVHDAPVLSFKPVPKMIKDDYVKECERIHCGRASKV